MKASFLNLINQKGIYIEYALHPKTHQKIWFIIKVHKEKYLLFKHYKKNSLINLQDFGIILEKGFGEKVPSEILQKYI